MRDGEEDLELSDTVEWYDNHADESGRSLRVARHLMRSTSGSEGSYQTKEGLFSTLESVPDEMLRGYGRIMM